MAKGPWQAGGGIWRWGGHSHIPCKADKGLLVINRAYWSWWHRSIFFTRSLLQSLAVPLERLLLAWWAFGQFSMLCRQTLVCKCSLWFPLSSLIPIKGSAEYSNKEARRVKFINDCGKFGFHGCQQLLCRLRWVEITAQGCYFARRQDTITNDKLNSLLQQGGGISLCEPGAYLTGEAALSGFLLFLAVLMPANAYSSVLASSHLGDIKSISHPPFLFLDLGNVKQIRTSSPQSGLRGQPYFYFPPSPKGPMRSSLIEIQNK